jgi:H+/Cl- antiporter ClcA
MFLLLILVFLTVLSTCATVYYGAVVSGMYKDTLMARFCSYGDEPRPSPLSRFLLALAAWCVMGAIMVTLLAATSVLLQSTPTPAILFWLAVLALAGSIVVGQTSRLREVLPRWYCDLLHHATREERRLIAYAWWRLPRKLRWRLNGDQAAFRVWLDMVRLTIIYGAHNPDNPWNTWI